MLLVAGIWVRTLPAGSLRPTSALGWRSTTSVNLYFVQGTFLFPVSRRFVTNGDLPRAVLEALLAGPTPTRAATVKSAIPPDVTLRSFSLRNGLAQIDLSREPGRGDDARLALAAITATMTGMSGIRSVAVSVQGTPVQAAASRTALLYFPSTAGLLAVPTNATDPRTALAAYLSGPPSRDMTGIPTDVRLQAYDFASADHALSLRFSYTPAMRALAIEHPDRTRMLLLGVIATLTEFPDVRTVRLDFGGQARLGFGECSDLLRTPQPRPALLNDERLLD